MCLTSDAVYRIRDADTIFRIERKDDQKIAQNSQLFFRKYFEITSNTSGRVRGTLWRIVSKYILFLRMVQSFYRRHLQNTTNNVTGAQEDHDRSRYAAYSVNAGILGSICIIHTLYYYCIIIAIYLNKNYLSLYTLLFFGNRGFN